MTWQECLKNGIQALEEQGIRDSSSDAWILLEYTAGITRTEYLMRMPDEMPKELVSRFGEAIQERLTGKPVQHITGEQSFMGLTFSVNEHVLIPRQETELLVEEALRLSKPGMRVLDLCTGSGCILTSLMKYSRELTGVGADVSEKALEMAARNLKQNDVQAELVRGDLFENLQGEFDLIVSNPPYIKTAVIESLEPEVRDHDPMLALDGKEDGLYFYRQIIIEGKEYLKDGGYLLFEIGYDQGESVPALLEAAGYEQIQVKKDLAGLDRVVIAVYNKAEKRRR
jgi:release factor glutamine methyltransferase